jgi:hypothetical protein
MKFTRDLIPQVEWLQELITTLLAQATLVHREAFKETLSKIFNNSNNKYQCPHQHKISNLVPAMVLQLIELIYTSK